jgi:alcohol dehydrogenase (cytochrome c)
VYWNGPGYSPATGLAYVNAVDWCKTVALEAQPEPYVPGQPWLGSSDGNGVKDATKSGWVNAIDAATGAIVWQYHAALPMVAGVTPTAGGLVFTADLAGNVLAFNASTGALLTTVATGLPVGGGVISYAVNGKQYVAVAAGFSSGDFQTPTTTAALIVLGM